MNVAQIFVFIRQLTLILGGTSFVASIVPLDVLLKIVDTLGTMAPGFVTLGTVLYGIFRASNTVVVKEADKIIERKENANA